MNPGISQQHQAFVVHSVADHNQQELAPIADCGAYVDGRDEITGCPSPKRYYHEGRGWIWMKRKELVLAIRGSDDFNRPFNNTTLCTSCIFLEGEHYELLSEEEREHFDEDRYGISLWQ